MRNAKIRATLDCNPGFAPAPAFYKIIKGASAYLTYNISNKSFSMDKIEQITFTFKQGSKYNAISMFDYLVKTTDTEIEEGKDYYLVENIQETGQCDAILVEEPVAEDLENYYEITDLSPNTDGELYSIDSHFSIKVDGTNVFVLFCFNPEETRVLKTTEMQFEIAVRLDTDNEDYLSNRDSLIIEPQVPIIIMDSLYSHIK